MREFLRFIIFEDSGIETYRGQTAIKKFAAEAAKR
jgi:hypothetical protein